MIKPRGFAIKNLKAGVYRISESPQLKLFLSVGFFFKK
jgi:hypothetical protein